MSDLFLDADFDGDRRSDMTVARRGGNISWFSILNQSNTVSQAYWGGWGDLPIALRWDDDSISDRGVYRPSEGQWYIVSSTGGVSSEQWGLAGDIPVAEDYNGDGVDELAVWRPSFGLWALRQGGDQGENVYRFWGTAEGLSNA